MNTQQKKQMEEIIAGLHEFTKTEHPPTKPVVMQRLGCLQLGPNLFIKIKPCNDAIAKGIKFETYSTSSELSAFYGVSGKGFYRSNRKKCTMHLDGKRYVGLVFRSNMYEDDQTAMILECREYIMYILRTFYPDYIEGPYRRSAERVQVMNLLN